MSPEAIGGPAMWANYGALGLVTLFTLSLLTVGARWLLSFVMKREAQFAEENRWRNQLFADAIKEAETRQEGMVSGIMASHERTNAALVASIDRNTQELRAVRSKTAE